MSRSTWTDTLTGLLCVLAALALLYLIWAWEPPRPPDRPVWTPVVIVVTATPGAIHAGPPTTRTPTRAPLVEMTPLIREPILTTPLPTPTSTPTAEPTATPSTETPRPAATMIQRG